MEILFWMSTSFDRHTTSEHLLVKIIEALCKDNNSVHILQKNTGGSLPPIPEKLQKYGVTTTSIPILPAKKSSLVTRYLSEIKYVRKCREVIDVHYDAVFIQSTNVAGFVVKELRKKLPYALITYNVQDVFPYNAVYSGKIKKDSLVFRVFAGVQRHGYKHADYVITISEDMKDQLVEDGVDPKKIEVIYNWSYQDEIYDKRKLDMTVSDRLFKKDYFNVVYAGNIGIMQNVDILIEAAALMKGQKDIWFHIIGDGVSKDKLKRLVREYKITNISFWPMQSPKIAPAIYAAADVNVIPLVKNVYQTALPSKTATCLASGSPIIFAIGRESKFGKWIEEQTGFPVIDSDDPMELCKSIEKIKAGDRGTIDVETFKSVFSGTLNSRRYARVIQGKA